MPVRHLLYFPRAENRGLSMHDLYQTIGQGPTPLVASSSMIDTAHIQQHGSGLFYLLLHPSCWIPPQMPLGPHTHSARLVGLHDGCAALRTHTRPVILVLVTFCVCCGSGHGSCSFCCLVVGALDGCAKRGVSAVARDTNDEL